MIPMYDLSPELIYSIFEFLPTQDLKAAALVCREWHIISAPLLYHTIKIVDQEHVVNFVGLILDKFGVDGGQRERGGNVTLYFATSVRRLDVYQVPKDDETGPKDLRDAISRLTKLEHLHWDVRASRPLEPRIIILPENLPGLRSLSLVLTSSEFLVRDPNKVGALTNLREFSVKFYETNRMGQECIRGLLDVIRDAFNLESLSVAFPGERDFDPLSNHFFSALSQCHFPELRQLRSRSYHLVVSSRSDKSIFRQFMQSHTHLHTIMIRTISRIRFWGTHRPEMFTLTSEEVTELMPAVRHFLGPYYMFEALLGSTLAGQLEELSLTDSGDRELGSIRDLELFNKPLLKNSNSMLPHLKRLRIESLSVPWDAIFTFLGQFAWRVPELEDLDVRGRIMWWHDSSVLDHYMQNLDRFPQLRTLSLNDSPFAAVEESTLESNMRFFMGIAEICPLLATVHFLVNGERRGCWEIMRQRGRPVDVVYTQRHEFPNPYGWKGSIYRTISKPPVTRWHLHLESLE